MFSEILPVIPTEEANAASDQAEGSCTERQAVPNTAKKRLSADALARKTHSTARLAVPVRRSAQGDIVGAFAAPLRVT